MPEMIQHCGRAVNTILRPLGVRVARAVTPSAGTRATTDGNDLGSALNRIRQLNLNIQTIIDVGASDGSWSKTARHYLPETSILAFEPLEERWPAIENWRASDSRVHLVKGVAGSAPGTVPFHVADDLDGSGIGRQSEDARMVPIATIDDEITSRALPGPFLIKLDTHGYELPILQGASETLKQTCALVIEVYNFNLTGESLRFHEMCAHLAPHGFRCYDIFDILRRPSDNTLWQADFVFLKDDHSVFQKTTYS